MRTARTALVTGLLFAAMASGASAQSAPALVVNDLHHRAGPTSNSPSVGVIRGGITIEAGTCGGGWCQAFLNGNPGFVSQQYLDFGGPPPGAYSAPPDIYAPRAVYPPYHRSGDSRRW
jgi:uncharacterized protein YraI